MYVCVSTALFCVSIAPLFGHTFESAVKPHITHDEQIRALLILTQSNFNSIVRLQAIIIIIKMEMGMGMGMVPGCRWGHWDGDGDGPRLQMGSLGWGW